MQMRIASLLLLASCLAFAAPAHADTLYKNGPVNGICDIEHCTVDAWTINFGYVVTASFTISSSSTVQGFNFAFWMFTGDTLTSVERSLGTCEFCSKIAQGTASGPNLTTSLMSTNQYGYNIWAMGVTGLNIPLAVAPPNSYWLSLQNAVAPSGDPVYWDENGGPSLAYTQCIQGDSGCIPSESFNIVGTTTVGTTPEPSSLTLFGAGLVGLAGVLRRSLWK